MTEHTDEFKNLLIRTPNKILSNGIIFISVFISLILILAYIVKYPDVIEGRVTLTTRVPPLQVVAKSTGNIIMFVDDRDSVEKNQVLAVIENEANEQDIFDLYDFVKNNSFDEISSTKISEGQYGSVQNVLQETVSILTEIKRFEKDLFNQEKVVRLKGEVVILSSSLNDLQTQKQLYSEELEIIERKFKLNKILFDSSVISKFDLDAHHLELLRSKQKVINLNNTIDNTKRLIYSQKDRIIDFKKNNEDWIYEKKKQYSNQLALLENVLDTWMETYVLRSPYKGVISFSQIWTSGQFVSINESVFRIIPNNNELIGKAFVSTVNAANLNSTNDTKIELDDYPMEEYGLVNGKIESISLLPNDGFYILQLQVPNDLSTNNFPEGLKFKNEMSGRVFIVTKKKRLITRFYEKLGIFNKFQ